MTGPQAVRVVGGLVPPGMFARVQTRDVRDAASLAPTSYGLTARETIRDAANRSWTYLRGAWTDWREHAAGQPGGVAGAGPTRDRWLLVLVRELGYGQLPPLKGGLDVDGVGYPVSHLWQHVPIHLLGSGVDLDRRNPGVTGAARAPQSMVQELLNRSEPHLWALLSNGLRLRVLRDSTSLAGSAYVEFDLEAIFDGELFAEFLLLWQVCHVSRFSKRGDADAPPSDCWMEAWRGEAVDGGTRALNQLRDSVEKAIIALGTGFLRHPGNRALIDALRSGRLTREQYHRALLRLVYRLLFLSVAEARGVLLHGATPEIIDRYTRFYSVARLRALSRVRAGGPHGDLWQGLTVVLGALGGAGLPALGLPALAGLFDPADAPLDDPAGAPVDHLLACGLANHDLLTAMRHLGWLAGRGPRVQPVDYRNLGAEELGSVYESLLELVPRLDLPESTFTLEAVAGNERKTTGSYYTPASLVSALLDSALDPLLDDAVKNAVDSDDAVRRLLALTVCDPACGSGHFLVAAARRIARRVAQLRSGDEEPSPAEVQHALREVVGSCIYGVDVNPFAAELAKVSLWMEALEPGKPLGFLDARIRVGNSLLGTTPALLAQGVPDAAFKELEGDDKAIAAATRKLNKKERTQRGIYETGVTLSNIELAERRAHLVALADAPDAVRTQAKAWQWYDRRHHQLVLQRTQADAWCAAFVWNLVEDGPEAPTTAIVHGLASSPDTQPERTRAEIARLACEYGFFHWHLEFPEIFPVTEDHGDLAPEGWSGGFSCLLGNPPWERVKLQEQEYFAARDADIAQAPNKAARQRLITALATSESEADRALHRSYRAAKHQAEGESALLRTSGRYPLTGRGDVNTYAVFAETFRSLIEPYGRTGVIVPTGIATDATTQYFFGDLIETSTLAALYDFENRTGFFEGVDSRTKFSLLTMSGRSSPEPATHFAFFLRAPEQIADTVISISPDDIIAMSPNSKTCPVFRSKRDAEITLTAYAASSVLRNKSQGASNPWPARLTTMFHKTNDADLLHEFADADVWSIRQLYSQAQDANLLPVYEGRMGHQFDHRYELSHHQHDTDSVHQAEARARPYLWAHEKDFKERVERLNLGSRAAFLGQRRVARNTDERTSIAAIFPFVPSTYGWILTIGPDARQLAILCAIYNSFIYDYLLRNFLTQPSVPQGTAEQIGVPSADALRRTCAKTGFPTASLLGSVVELTYTSHDLASFAAEIGWKGPPFRWNSERRRTLKAELDALMFHAYNIGRDDVEHVLHSFPIVKEQDLQQYGEFKTLQQVLTAYDRMSDSKALTIDPQPGSGERHPVRREIA